MRLSLTSVTAQVREYLEKHYEDTSGDATAKLALKALTETVEASSKNIEVAVTTKDVGQCCCCPAPLPPPARTPCCRPQLPTLAGSAKVQPPHACPKTRRLRTGAYCQRPTILVAW